MDFLENYYNNYDEEGRLLSPHGRVEYITTQKYIHEALGGDTRKTILEIGAGTGRYSVALAREGYPVTAVELIEHNLELLRSKLDGTEPIRVLQGNALDLSRFEDGSFDLTLVLGPMYHLYTREDKLRALSEAVRVTRPGGRIMVAYCMNEPTVVQYVFGLGHLREILGANMLTEDWHCISRPEDLFELVRPEDIAELDAAVPVRRIKLIASDGATNYMRELIDAMDEETYAKWIEYHLTVCERQDLIGASHHTLDILQKL
ncbi:MAG: methyltransferase domain-containing protein [Oscillospiraceae bacterium]|nr:methyltransferase domain-containing protein [Oscillospiraceae bacterium]